VFVVGIGDLSNRGVESDNYERRLAARPLGRMQLWNAAFIGGGNQGFETTPRACTSAKAPE
jgi:hypothetical protein